MEVVFINCIFLAEGLVQFIDGTLSNFLIDFRELGYFRNLLPYSLGVGILVFQMGYDILYTLRDLEWVLGN